MARVKSDLGFRLLCLAAMAFWVSACEVWVPNPLEGGAPAGIGVKAYGEDMTGLFTDTPKEITLRAYVQNGFLHNVLQKVEEVGTRLERQP